LGPAIVEGYASALAVESGEVIVKMHPIPGDERQAGT